MNIEGQRRLVAILHGDVVGYSRLMGEDELRTVSVLMERREAIRETVQKSGGRVVNMIGDSILAEFPSVVDCVGAAIEIQESMLEHNERAEGRPIEIRIGVNLGDVYTVSEDIHGDGVNVAARIQQIANPGGVFVSGSVFDSVRGQFGSQFDYIGEQNFKNIREPVRVFSYRCSNTPEKDQPHLHGNQRHSSHALSVRQPAIAMSVFRSLSEDKHTAVIAEGIFEELRFMLSSVSSILVHALHQDVDQYGSADTMSRLSQLGLPFLLSGAVRQAGDRVRVSAQLIETSSNRQIWADQYDEIVDNILRVQEDISRKVVVALEVTLTEGEQASIWRGTTNNAKAWQYFIRAYHQERYLRRDTHAGARKLFEAAIQLDPNYASAMVGLAFCHLEEVRFGWSRDPKSSLAAARKWHSKAVAVDPDEPDVYYLSAFIQLQEREFEPAVADMNTALALQPRSAERTAGASTLLVYLGQNSEAIAHIERAMQLSPYYPTWFLGNLAWSNLIEGNLAEALAIYQKVFARTPDYLLARIGFTSLLGELDDSVAARQQADHIRRLDPLFRVDRWADGQPYRKRQTLERLIVGLHKAGFSS